MRAVFHDTYGSPDVLRLEDVERPVPGEDEVLVRVHATTVNRTDCHRRAAEPFAWRLIAGLRRPRRQILGSELAGQVAAVGPAVTEFAVGDPVFGLNPWALGAHAEFVCVRASGLIAHKPACASFAEAAAVCDGALNALSALRRAGLRTGHKILIYGASGSIGTAAVQLARHMKADVTAVCDTRNLATVTSLGADRVIDYTAEDFTDGGHRYDVVFDAVGLSSFGQCKRVLKPGGIFMSTGPGPGYQNLMLPVITPLLRGKKVLFAYPHFDQAALRYIRDMIESGDFRPIVDRQYPLEQIVEAYTYVETGQKIGNVVIGVVAAPR